MRSRSRRCGQGGFPDAQKPCSIFLWSSFGTRAWGRGRRGRRPKKLAGRIGAIRDLSAKAPAAWSVGISAGAFRGTSKGDVEEVLDSLAALGILAGYESRGILVPLTTQAQNTPIKASGSNG